ncbi:hypothetical protein Dpoa2040_001222 [Dickeya sp. CFBP 2040]|uniref:Uncharacterized protein n=1 Tax=Dickeya poaceiphila TaxID=568768 RepID=A0A5B8I872_9GAMM|nr:MULTISPECIES: hypothetical protein [Dickeya]NKI73991.1 hypothetical protein [Dickeya sp. CFBP 2040]QDX30068.1 hypothetical protein Dpoa569_0001923 [Dickeya poaceiphila]
MSNSSESDTAFDDFLTLSALLTGFSRFELTGTGLAHDYFTWLQQAAAIPFRQLQHDFSAQPDDEAIRLNWLQATVLTSSSLGPVTRSLLRLWYTGQWVPVSPAPNDTATFLSDAAWREALIWQAIHAHPQAIRQQEFGAWAEPPTAEWGAHE